MLHVDDDAFVRAPVALVHLHGWRHDAGSQPTLEGDLDGRAEFWLEEGRGGTVIHHLASFESTLRPARAAQRTYRRVLRRGSWACQDVLQTQMRERAGVSP